VLEGTSDAVGGIIPAGRVPSPPRRRPKDWRRREAVLGGLFIGPALLGVIGLALVPFGFVIWYGFHNWQPLIGEFTWIGLDNYIRLFQDGQVWNALRNTFVFALLLLVLNVSLALALAVMLNRPFRGRAVFRAIFFLPVIVSSVAWVLIWEFLVAYNGGINGALQVLGIPPVNWLREPATALATVVVIQVFKGVGMNMILFLAALQNVPNDLIEAARIDGAGAFRRFRSVVLPLLTPTVLMVMIITIIGAMDVFVPIQVLTAGGPGNSTTVISYLVYRTAFGDQEFGYASVLGVLMFVIVLTLTLVQWSTRKRWVHDEV